MTSFEDYEIDFGKAEETAGGPPLEAGYYQVKIVKTKAVQSAAKKTPGVELTMKVVDGPAKGRQVWETLWATPKTYSRYRELLEAIGEEVPSKGTRTTLAEFSELFHGATCYTLLEIQVGREKPEGGTYPDRNSVAFSGGFLSIEQFDAQGLVAGGEDGPSSGDLVADDDDLLDDDLLDADEPEDEPDPEHVKAKPAAAKKKAKPAEPVEEPPAEDYDPWDKESLDALGGDDLKAAATELGVELPQRLTAAGRVRLVQAILTAQEAAESSDAGEPEEDDIAEESAKATEPEADGDDDIDLDDFDLD